MSQALGLLVVVLLVGASAYFVAMEFSFTAANRNRLIAAEAGGDRRAGAALRVLKRLSFCLSGAQLGITFAALLTGFVAEPVFAALFEPGLSVLGVPDSARGGVSLTLGFVISTFALMVVGELAPKNLAIAVPEQTARALARSTLLFMRVGGPVIRLFDGAANRLLKRLGITPIQEAHGAVTSEDLARIIDSSASSGHLSVEETRLLGRALDFGELTAADVMVPRPRVVTLDEDADGAALRAVLRDSGHSRVPLTRGPQESVVGLVAVKDLLDLPPERRDSIALRELSAPAVLRMPETAPLVEVVRQMRHGRTPFAVAVDEHGSDVGVLTLEDVVEELVGEVRDEHDVDRPAAAGLHTVPGRWHLHEVLRETGVRLPDGDYDTLAGLVLARLGRIPVVGDEVTVEAELERDGDGGFPPRVTARLRVESLAGRAVGDVHLDAQADA